MSPVIADNKNLFENREDHGIVLPTEELRGALQKALMTEKSGTLSEEDLARMDETVSKYLAQQLKLNALRAQAEAPVPVESARAWHQSVWVQLAAGAMVFLLAGFLYLHQLG